MVEYFMPDPSEEANALVRDMTKMLELWNEEGTTLNDGEYARLLTLIERGRAYQR